MFVIKLREAQLMPPAPQLHSAHSLQFGANDLENLQVVKLSDEAESEWTVPNVGVRGAAFLAAHPVLSPPAETCQDGWVGG